MTDEELENTLVEKLCERNGWKMVGEEYDMAVIDIKWFFAEAKPAIEKQERERVLDTMEKGYLPSESSAFAGTKIRMLTEEDWQSQKEGKSSGQERP